MPTGFVKITPLLTNLLNTGFSKKTGPTDNYCSCTLKIFFFILAITQTFVITLPCNLTWDLSIAHCNIDRKINICVKYVEI